jgi:hypothetical protein
MRNNTHKQLREFAALGEWRSVGKYQDVLRDGVNGHVFLVLIQGVLVEGRGSAPKPRAATLPSLPGSGGGGAGGGLGGEQRQVWHCGDGVLVANEVLLIYMNYLYSIEYDSDE